MSNTPHDLTAEFPEFAETMTQLKQRDAHFARMAADYREVNGAIHLAETNIAPIDDLPMLDLRKRRARLKDAIFARLRDAQPAG